MLTFPTKPAGHRKGRAAELGQPKRAQACQCGPQAFIHDGECVRCGRFTERTINVTWHERAMVIARQRALAQTQRKLAAV